MRNNLEVLHSVDGLIEQRCVRNSMSSLDDWLAAPIHCEQGGVETGPS